MDAAETPSPGFEQRNFVVLQGRVSTPAAERRLPSGDAMVTTRVVVDREQRRSRSGRVATRKQVDAIDCVAWTSRLQRVVRRWQPGDEVYLEGALRRRFFRSDGGRPGSRWEVELSVARTVRATASRPARQVTDGSRVSSGGVG